MILFAPMDAVYSNMKQKPRFEAAKRGLWGNRLETIPSHETAETNREKQAAYK
jgi:hypothetical protein